MAENPTTETESEVTKTAGKSREELKRIKLERKRKAAKGRKGIFLLYWAALLVLTGLFVYHAVDYLYLQPMAHAGAPVFGSRLELLDEIPERVPASAQSFANGLEGVTSSEVSVEGANVFIKLIVPEGTALDTARHQAESVALHFREEAGGSDEGYGFQLVVSTPDFGNDGGLRDYNRELMAEHTHQFALTLISALAEFAEQYPTIENITRVLDNASVNRTRQRISDEELAEFEGRMAALTPWTDEESENWIELHGKLPRLAELPYDNRIPPSNLAEFPSWGTINQETGAFIWN